jgi:F0F1-type ATP synthase assembly protein I
MRDDEPPARDARSDTPAPRGPADGPSAGAYAGLGLQLLASILIFLYAGQWLDERFGTKGLWTLAGVLFGAGTAIYSAYRRLTADQRREDEARRR